MSQMKGDLPQMKRILLVLTVFVCYYGTGIETFVFLTE